MRQGQIVERLEAGLVRVVWEIFRAIPLDAASAIGGWLGRNIAYRLPISEKARSNLRRVLPDMTAAEREAVIRRMWDNLGRVAAEYPHLQEFGFGPGQRVEVIGLEHLERMRDDGRPGLCFGAHYGNWELLAPCAMHNGLPLHMIYRAANNPRVNWIFAEGRGSFGTEQIPKGAEGARRTLALLKRGEHVGMLIDQKMNDGIAVPFFGIAAMTAPAIAALAMKFDCPVVPARIERLGGARFRMTLYPPMEFERTGARRDDLVAAMTRVNHILEDWIRDRPDHWLWLHRRWPDE